MYFAMCFYNVCMGSIVFKCSSAQADETEATTQHAEPQRNPVSKDTRYTKFFMMLKMVRDI